MKYQIQRQCPCVACYNRGCQSCNYTGWKNLAETNNRDEAKQLRRYWQKYFGNQIKIRMKIN